MSGRMPSNPLIPDPEIFQDFVDALGDHIPAIERDIGRLKKQPEDRSVLADLFRAVHTIKGDAALCKLDLAVRIAHPIESVLSRLREGELHFTDLIGEAVLLALDRLELAVDAIGGGRSVENLRLPELIQGLDALGACAPAEADHSSSALIEAVTGFQPVGSGANTGRPPLPSVRSNEQLAGDLRYFRSLAQQFETRSPQFRGRSARLLKLALETNNEAGKPVDPVQLAAAVYMHDIGMMFVPESVWLKVGKLSDEEKEVLRQHPHQAAGLLERMHGWEEATRMVAEHHEMPDGEGYPKGLKADEICPGAKILAIVDAFEAVTLKHHQRGQTRSLLRAIAEVNACDKQFAPEWIGPFNAVVRRQVEAGA
ncbi:MAG TPA: HD domain-containing phosphohydrolase [Azospira sp.]|nr:HD domain-containing phosphohydrolase [Azospira sp.]